MKTKMICQFCGLWMIGSHIKFKFKGGNKKRNYIHYECVCGHQECVRGGSEEMATRPHLIGDVNTAGGDAEKIYFK